MNIYVWSGLCETDMKGYDIHEKILTICSVLFFFLQQYVSDK